MSLLRQDQRRKTLSNETSLSGIEMPPCSGCRNAKAKIGRPRPRCIVGTRSGRCSECIRKGRRCDATSNRPEWERLRDVRESLQKDLERAEEWETELLQRFESQRAKVINLRKQVRQQAASTDLAVEAELDDVERADNVWSELLKISEEQEQIVAEQAFPFHELLDVDHEDAAFGNDCCWSL